MKINSLLNMSFIKWIDIFTYRQKWENNIQFDKIKNYLEKIKDENDSCCRISRQDPQVLLKNSEFFNRILLKKTKIILKNPVEKS